jgi:hypothetical protein
MINPVDVTGFCILHISNYARRLNQMTDVLNLERWIPNLLNIIQRWRSDGRTEFYTGDLISEFNGIYAANIGTLPSNSINAHFGKELKRLCNRLGIRELEQKVPVPDNLGNQTTNSKWEII